MEVTRFVEDLARHVDIVYTVRGCMIAGRSGPWLHDRSQH